MKQGCFFSPYLFILVIGLLSYLMGNSRYRIYGLELLGGLVVKDQSFAHDTTFYLIRDINTICLLEV